MQEDISLAQFTTLGIGGPAKFFTTVKSKDELIQAIQFVRAKNLPYLVIGSGSNLLISDEGFDGLIIKNELTSITLASQGPAFCAYQAQSGTSLWNLVQFTLKNGLSGLQKLSGIPGTLGGAVYGNAGAYGQSISDHLTKVLCLDPKSDELVTLSKDECNFNYRDSNFKKNGLIILEVYFELEPANPEVLKQESQDTLEQRRKYDGLRCPGSFFKNIPVEIIPNESLRLIPEDKINHGKIPVGYLLESIGAKGQKSGDVEVSDFHANIIINKGQGKAEDFYKLVSDFSKKVKEKFGINLEPEVQLINLPPLHS